MFVNNREWEMQILMGIEHLVHLLIEASYSKGIKKENLLQQAVSHLRGLNPLLLKLIDGKEEHLESLIRQLFSQKLPPGFLLTSFGGLKHDLDYVIQQALVPLPPQGMEEATGESEIAGQQVENCFPEKSSAIDNQSAGIEDNELSPVGPVASGIPIDNTLPANASAENSLAEFSPKAAPAKETPLEEKPAGQPVQSASATKLQPSLADIISNFYPGEKVITNYTFRSIVLDYFLPDRKIAFVLLSPQKRIHHLHHLLLKREGITLIEVNPKELNNIRLLSRHLPKY